jgi:hypothetical protein
MRLVYLRSATLLEVVHELAGPDFEATRQSQDRRQAGLTRPALQPTYSGRVHVRVAVQPVLREAVLDTQIAQPLPECDARGVRIFVEVVHPAMLDPGSQSVQSALVGSGLV